MMTPEHRKHVAQDSKEKGLIFQSSFPYKGTLFKDAKLIIGNVLDAAFMIVKEKAFEGKTVSDRI